MEVPPASRPTGLPKNKEAAAVAKLAVCPATVAADPDALARLVRGWMVDRPAALTGIIWYRLPVAGDTRNWSWPTLARVSAGEAPRTRAAVDVQSTVETVRPVCDDVAARGDAAVLDATERFDGVRPEALRVPAEALKQALENLDPAVRDALEDPRHQVVGE